MNTVASLPVRLTALVSAWRARNNAYHGECADELEDALASPAPSAGVGVEDGWALTKLRAHESRCGECGRAVWDGKDQAACIGFLAPCGKRIARLEDCGTGVSPALPAGLDLPSATEWTQNNEVAASFDWMAGWDACRVEYPHRISSAPWRREWQGSGDQRGFHIVEAVRLTHNRRIAYLGDQASGEAVDAIIAAHNATATPEQPGSAVQGEAVADYVPGELDRTAPARVWLQIDTSASNDERDDPWPGAEHVTWQDESIGGLEIQYVRADLATTPPPAPAAEQGEQP